MTGNATSLSVFVKLFVCIVQVCWPVLFIRLIGFLLVFHVQGVERLGTGRGVELWAANMRGRPCRRLNIVVADSGSLVQLHS